MRARSLPDLMQLPVELRYAELAKGLELLLEHVQTLVDDSEFLLSSERRRSAMAVNLQAEEEAAKILILLDQARLGWKRQEVVATNLRRFANHLARGIYAEVANTRPADFAEVRRIVDRLRVSHYLDGPNDVDWVFRNEIWARREESLYVDYVVTDEGRTWMSPADKDSWPFNRSRCPELALALGHTGATSLAGLQLITKRWQGVEIKDGTRWTVVAALNDQVLHDLEAAALLTPELTIEDVRRIRDQWNFPLYDLDLSLISVGDTELRHAQQRWLDQQWV